MNFRFCGKSVLVSALVLLLSAAAMWAQRETGQIGGTVHDPSGAVIAGAKVTVKSAASGLTREATTNGFGIFTVPSLRPDAYEVTIAASGFETRTQQVQVTVGSASDVSVQMAVSGSSTVIEVTGSAGAVAVNTENQTNSQVITAKQLSELPTSPTRNPYTLVGTAGGVAEDAGSNRGAGFSINGQRSSSTGLLLDGAENVNTFDTTVGQMVPLDSVQEFSVLTNNFTAEYGRAAGGVVNVVTKSGSNVFHGSAYEFSRLSALSSNTFNNNANGIDKGVFTRNDFGFAVGGPIKKDKIFFFDNAEWIKVRSASPTTYTVIDPGSITKLAPASQSFFNTYGKLSPDVHILKQMPCVSGSVLTCDAVNYSVAADAGGGAPQNTWMEVARVDYNLTEKTNLFVRYAGYNQIEFPGTIVSSPYAGFNTGQTRFDQNVILTLTHVFTPNLVNTGKVIFNRLNGPVQTLGANPASPTLYTATSVPSVGGYQLVFPGYSETTPGNGIPFGGPQNLYQIVDDVSYTHGKHQLKFGTELIQIRDNRLFGAYMNPVEALGTNLSSGLQGLINGTIYQFQGAISPQGKYPCPLDANGVAQVSPACTVTLPVSNPSFERNYRYNDMAFYAQDAWKVAPRFTVNLGLRWEYYGVQHNADPSLDSNFVLGSGNNIFQQVRNGSVQLAKNGGIFWKPDYNNFAPRVGLAWDVFGDGSTSLRAGYSIAYDRNFGNVTYNAIQNPPAYAVVSLISNQDVNYTMPVYTNTAGPMGGTGSKALPPVSQRAIDQNMKTAYAETWGFGIDRRLSKGSMLAISYSGAHGLKLYDIANLNPAEGGNRFLGDARDANKLNYQYSNMNYRSGHGFSRYNGLNVKYSANNLMNSGLGVTMNYTWSHSVDILSSTFTEGAGGLASGNYQLGYLDEFNPRLNYGNSDFDIRQRLIIAQNWDIPFMKNARNPLERHILGGWVVSSNLNIRTGQPFSLYDCTNYGGTNCPEYVPNAQVATRGSAVATGDANTFNYISLPAAKDGSVANIGDSLGMPTCTGLYHQGCQYTASGLPYPARNQYFGPGFWNMDMNLFKNFRLSEKAQLQFRAEMYNIFNHSNQYINYLNLDVTSMSSPFVQSQKGGQWGIAGQPDDERRNMQFALKLTF